MPQKFKGLVSGLLQNKLSSYCPQEVIDDLFEELMNGYNGFFKLFNTEKNRLEPVYLGNILYIHRDGGKKTVFVTREAEYIHCINYEAILDITQNFNFKSIDSRVVVNLDQVKKYNSQMGRVYFDDIITPQSIFTPMAQRAEKILKDNIGEENDVSKNNNVKYSGLKEIKKTIFNKVRQELT